MQRLVLSLFPGIGLLDMAFEQEGFCVVRGPDLLWGGDVRTFHPPAGVFDGIIGGPPCQEFSPLRKLCEWHGHKPRFGNLIPEFERVIAEACPDWFVMENVPDAPLPSVDGYKVTNYLLDNRWFGGIQRRTRRFSFGRKGEAPATLTFAADVVLLEQSESAAPVTSSDGGGKTSQARYTVDEMLRYQELDADFLKYAPFTVEGKKHALANGVPLPLGRAIARAVKRALEELYS